MIVRTTPRLATLGTRFRTVVLVLFALFVAHDAIYVAQFGVGGGFADAMTESGHDAYWTPASLLIGIGAAVSFLAAIAVLARLERGARAIVAPVAPGASYAGEIALIWRRLFPTVALLYLVQENLEHLAVTGQPAGLNPLFGAGSSYALPVLAITTLVLALVGAVIRWRIRTLALRIAVARRRPYSRITVSSRPAGWVDIAAEVAHRWTVDRLDAGRAPPRILPPLAIATA